MPGRATLAADCVVTPRDGKSALDLGRNVHAHLGLVFDAVTLTEATAHLRDCAARHQRCFLSTPNVNFSMAAMHEPAFRNSVLQSDFSIADGMPVVALARWAGVPLPERVAGSDVFEDLRRGVPDQPRLPVFFFGGEDGVAERAAHALDAEGAGMSCAGFLSPGFGSIESMSTEAVIERINAARPAFLVVSLGAMKGQAWIQCNRARLSTPLISHLGAVVNFVAGHVRRAPRWMQAAGLEWLWRVVCEPKLWRRYFDDGRAMLRWIMAVYPARRRLRQALTPAPPDLAVSTEPSAAVRLALAGHWTRENAVPLRRALARVLNEGREVRIDLSGTVDMDSSVLGLLALVHGWQQPDSPIVTRLSELRPRMVDRVRLHGMQFLFDDHARRSPRAG